MQRDKDIIIFSPEERLEFDVPEAIPVADALDVAVAFSDVAGKITDISIHQIAFAGNNAEIIGRVRKSQIRAASLGGFATRVFDLCPDEHLELIMKQASQPTI